MFKTPSQGTSTTTFSIKSRLYPPLPETATAQAPAKSRPSVAGPYGPIAAVSESRRSCFYLESLLRGYSTLGVQ